MTALNVEGLATSDRTKILLQSLLFPCVLQAAATIKYFLKITVTENRFRIEVSTNATLIPNDKNKAPVLCIRYIQS